MEFTDPFAPSLREMLPPETRIMTTDTTLKVVTNSSRRPSSRDNFSYPRLSRHESNESRSSDGSVPGMTDTSDSDVSFDDDGIYNTSAGELWDSFWPDSTSSIFRQSQEHHLILLHPGQKGHDFEIDPLERQLPSRRYGDDAKITTNDQSLKVEGLRIPSHTFQSPTSQHTPKSAVTYSVYPKIPVIHPPRTSSLSFEPPPSPQRSSPLKGSRSSAALRSSRPGHNIHPLFIPPSLASSSKATLQQSSTALKTAVSAPVSPVYPPPPPPKTLRPSTSAFSLRDMVRAHKGKNNNGNDNRGPVLRDATTSVAPLLPSPLPEPLPTRPQPERFVSVFEFDSDSETEADNHEGNSFAKRIARGLHKKSGSEKRGAAERKVATPRFASFDADASNKDLRERSRHGGSLSRKRGGSLGRIFGLMGR